MKNIFLLLAALAFSAALSVGCSSLLTKKAQASSLPVQAGMATTNDLATVAWLNLVRSENSKFNFTPTAPLADTAIGALIGLASAAAGYLARHKSNQPQTQVTSSGDKTPATS